MRICYYASHIGKIKSNNEDSFQINKYYKKINENDKGVKLLKNYNLISVCDGLGGEESGEVAADIAVKEMARISEQVDRKNINEKISYELDVINRKICAEIEKIGLRMGTTIASVFMDKNTATFFNIGDSRAYIFENGKLTQISQDHVVKNSDGTDSDKLSQHLGIFPDELIIEPYVVENISLSKKSYIVLCSDGIYKMLGNKKIEEILNKKTSLKSKVDEIINTSMENGGKDNLTVVLIKI